MVKMFHKSRLTLDCLDWARVEVKKVVIRLENKFDWINK